MAGHRDGGRGCGHIITKPSSRHSTIYHQVFKEKWRKKIRKCPFLILERPKTTYILIHWLFLDRLYHIIRIINAHPAPEGLVLLWDLKRALAWFSCSSCFTWDSSLKMNLRRQTFKAQSLRAGFSLIICYSANMIVELVLTSSALICGRWHHTTCSPLTLNCSVDKKLKTDWGLKLEPTCYSVHQIKKLNSLTNIVCVFCCLPLILHAPSSEIRILPAAKKQQGL